MTQQELMVRQDDIVKLTSRTGLTEKKAEQLLKLHHCDYFAAAQALVLLFHDPITASSPLLAGIEMKPHIESLAADLQEVKAKMDVMMKKTHASASKCWCALKAHNFDVEVAVKEEFALKSDHPLYTHPQLAGKIFDMMSVSELRNVNSTCQSFSKALKRYAGEVATETLCPLFDYISPEAARERYEGKDGITQGKGFREASVRNAKLFELLRTSEEEGVQDEMFSHFQEVTSQYTEPRCDLTVFMLPEVWGAASPKAPKIRRKLQHDIEQDKERHAKAGPSPFTAFSSSSSETAETHQPSASFKNGFSPAGRDPHPPKTTHSFGMQAQSSANRSCFGTNDSFNSAGGSTEFGFGGARTNNSNKNNNNNSSGWSGQDASSRKPSLSRQVTDERVIEIGGLDSLLLKIDDGPVGSSLSEKIYHVVDPYMYKSALPQLRAISVSNHHRIVRATFADTGVVQRIMEAYSKNPSSFKLLEAVKSGFSRVFKMQLFAKVSDASTDSADSPQHPSGSIGGGAEGKSDMFGLPRMIAESDHGLEWYGIQFVIENDPMDGINFFQQKKRHLDELKKKQIREDIGQHKMHKEATIYLKSGISLGAQSDQKAGYYYKDEGSLGYYRQYGPLTLGSHLLPGNYSELHRVELKGYVTEIADGCLNGLTSCREVLLRDIGPLKKIGANFLSSWSVTHVELPADLSELTHIGEGFMHGNREMTQLDFPPLPKIEHIGERFLGDTSLTKLTLRIGTKLTSLENTFVNLPVDCQLDLDFIDHASDELSYEEITKNLLSNEKKFDTSNFLYRSHFLKGDLPPVLLSLLKGSRSVIGSNVLSFCQNLTSLDLGGEPLPHITAVSHAFLAHNEKLTSVNLQSLVGVKKIGNSFLMCCTALRVLDFNGAFQMVEEIGAEFLRECTELELLPDFASTFGAKGKLGSVGDAFLLGCRNLRELDLEGLKHATAVGKDFLKNCHSLRKIDLSNLRKNKELETGFLGGCSIEGCLDLSPLVGVVRISRGALLDALLLSDIVEGAGTHSKVEIEFGPYLGPHRNYLLQYYGVDGSTSKVIKGHETSPIKTPSAGNSSSGGAGGFGFGGGGQSREINAQNSTRAGGSFGRFGGGGGGGEEKRASSTAPSPNNRGGGFGFGSVYSGNDAAPAPPGGFHQTNAADHKHGGDSLGFGGGSKSNGGGGGGFGQSGGFGGGFGSRK